MSSFLDFRAFPEGLVKRIIHWINFWKKFTGDLLQAWAASCESSVSAEGQAFSAVVLPSLLAFLAKMPADE